MNAIEAIAAHLRNVPPEQTTAEERLQAVRDRAVLLVLLRQERQDRQTLVEMAREMMLEMEVKLPDALRDIPRRILARRGL